MLEMLKTRKEALQKRGVKGFTLMEMLIVIAIIAVLVAIAIPVLGAQLDRAKAATDEANIRDGYASMQVQYLQSDVTAGTKYFLQNDGSVATTDTNAYTTQGNSDSIDANGVNVGGETGTKWTKDKKVTYTITETTTSGKTTSDIVIAFE